MAKRIQYCGTKLIRGDEIGISWERKESGKYETDMDGVTYELENRTANVRDETHDTGWYLYSRGADGDFFGKWCARTILEAVDVANEMIDKARLRGAGYGD